MPLVIGFVALLGAALLLTSAVADASFADVITGKAGQSYRAHETASTSSSTPATSSAAGPAPATPAGGYSPQTWAAALVTMLGVAPTKQAIANIVSWERQEGGHWNNSATYNPLNTTEIPASGGYSNTGTQGNIKAYTSWAQGLAATVATIKNGSYGGVIAALGAPSATFEAAVNASPWGTHF